MSDLEPRDLISAFIDGDLSGEELLGFEAAMAADPELAEEVLSLQMLVSELGDLPEMDVPAAVSEAVLARVEGLPIPGSEAAAAAASEAIRAPGVAEEGVRVITETGAAADIPRLAISALSGGAGFKGMLEALMGSLWIKVPAGAAVAALLALGMSHVISPSTVGPPMAEFASDDAGRGDMPVAAGAQEDDGVVALDTAAESRSHRETSPVEDADFRGSVSDPLMSRPAARVRSGSAAGPSSSSRTPEKARKAPDSAVGPEGVYEAEWETEDEQAVALAEENAPSPTGSDFKQTQEGAPPTASATPSTFGRAADVTMDGEPLEDHLDPEADKELLAKRGDTASRARAPKTKRESASLAYAGGSARSGAPVESAAMAPAPEPEPSAEPGARARKSAPQAGNTLTVASRAAANRLVQDLTAAPGVDVQVTRHPTFFTLALEVSVSDWDATVGTLRAAGGLDLSAGALTKGEQQRLALDVRW